MIVLDKRGVFASLLVLSVLAVPYLYVIERIIGVSGLIMPIGVRTSIIGIIYIWLIYIMFVKTKLNNYMAAAITLILALPAGMCIDGVISRILNQPLFSVWDVIAYSLVVIIAIPIFVIGFARYRK